MHDIVLYRPYRFHVWFLFLTIPIGILSFVAVGYGFPSLGVGVSFFVAMGIACAWLTKKLYDSSNTAVFFEREGLRIVGGHYQDYRFVLWDHLSYAYYVRNFKGHLFLVLSPRALSPQEAKRVANRGANSSNICVNDAVVIHFNAIQDTSQLKDLIDKHVLHVVTY